MTPTPTMRSPMILCGNLYLRDHIVLSFRRKWIEEADQFVFEVTAGVSWS